MITNLTEAMTAVVQARKIMIQVVETCTVEQLSRIEGIRQWLETHSIDRVYIEPQPEPIANSDGAWWYDGEPYMSNDAMESHLFHNVYGDRLGNSTVFDECYPVLIDGDWYWQE
jgi:hypothetical protein